MVLSKVCKDTMKLVWRWWQNLIITDKWQANCAWLLSLLLKVPQDQAENLIIKLTEFIVGAATANPGKGQGEKKWAFVWSKVEEELGDWLSAHGTQIMELVTVGLVRVLTVRSQVDPKVKT